MPPSKIPELLAQMDTKITALDKKVDRLEEKIFGNGKPGLLVDQILQSEKMNQLLVYAKENAENVERLKNVSTPTWLSKNWYKIVSMSILLILIVHSMIPEGTTLWQLISLMK